MSTMRIYSLGVPETREQGTGSAPAEMIETGLIESSRTDLGRTLSTRVWAGFIDC
jgi:hypothetical protein